MIFRAFRLFFALGLTVLGLIACGGGAAAPAPTGLKATAAETTVTVSWDMTPGVEYWLFYGPTGKATTEVSSMHGWIGLPGGGSKINVTSPYVVSGLLNGTSYSFSVNGRTDRGPGGPGAAPVSVTPRLAGSSWTAGLSAGSQNLRAIMFGTTYVAAGANGVLYASPDAQTWSAINYATTTALNGASYSGSYKLVGDGGLVLVSSDAVTWTPQTSATTQNLYAIASNNINLNVAVGANGTIMTSPDGVTWTAAASPTTQALYGVTYCTYNGGTWIAVGAAGTLLQSKNGSSWSLLASNTAADLRGVAYGASSSATGATAFVVIGSGGTVLSSGDGILWTARVLPVVSDLKAVTYGTQFVAVGSGGTIVVSTDGVTWVASSATGTSRDLHAVARGTLAYSTVGDAGTTLLAK